MLYVKNQGKVATTFGIRFGLFGRGKSSCFRRKESLFSSLVTTLNRTSFLESVFKITSRERTSLISSISFLGAVPSIQASIQFSNVLHMARANTQMGSFCSFYDLIFRASVVIKKEKVKSHRGRRSGLGKQQACHEAVSKIRSKERLHP